MGEGGGSKKSYEPLNGSAGGGEKKQKQETNTTLPLNWKVINLCTIWLITYPDYAAVMKNCT